MRHTRQRRGIVVAHILAATAYRLAIGVEAATGEAIAGATTATGKTGTIALGIEGTTAKRETRGRFALFAIVRKQLHHPAHRIGAIETATRAAYNLGALEHAWVEIVPRSTTRRCRTQTDTIDQ